jgi:hypothetical protein
MSDQQSANLILDSFSIDSFSNGEQVNKQHRHLIAIIKAIGYFPTEDSLFQTAQAPLYADRGILLQGLS